MARLGHREWNRRARGESDVQRVDRNYAELLQELRVAQTGVQILFGFLLSIGFTPPFRDLAHWQRGLYLVTLILAAASVAAITAPVLYHRLVFRRRLKPRLVQMAHRYALVGLALLLLALSGALTLACSMVLGVRAVAVCLPICVLLALAWYGFPLLHRARDERSADRTAS